MNIVVLDGYTVNPGDLSWDRLKEFGNLTVYDRTDNNDEQIIKRAQNCEIIITSKIPFNSDRIKRFPKLKYIGVIATGFNIIDTQAAADNNIIVTNIPDYSSNAVAQMTIAHMLELANSLSAHSDSVKAGDWGKAKDFCYWNHPQIEMANKTLGIIGMGNIGKKVAKIANALEMKVIAYNRSKKEVQGVTFTDMETLLTSSDVITIHSPLTDTTRNLINKESISKMKKSAFIINTSRGPIINSADLANALNNNVIAGAGVDVLEREPPAPDAHLLKAKNINITPHIAWATKEARARLINFTYDNIKSFLNNTPINRVN